MPAASCATFAKTSTVTVLSLSGVASKVNTGLAAASKLLMVALSIPISPSANPATVSLNSIPKN